MCRYVVDVCVYILDAYEKMEVEVDSEINMVKEINIKRTKLVSESTSTLISFTILVSESTYTSTFSYPSKMYLHTSITDRHMELFVI